ncbi:uncharacterized protein LOC129800098 [Phlebotomus papatasi]|uniref:uncharacterized protein LOC129800098 n=1 Tax=Phlebotomus papatasi TaxID=29031 RepID=UPI0024838A83|nr:uncharacterized protein LOC129800098 [Phlebotomus papatasi]
MSTIEERTAYLDNPFFTKHLYGNFSPFYVTIGICTLLGVVLFVLNIIFGCCSRHRDYWQDRHTGNRWLISIWSATPHKQPPLDLTELKDVEAFHPYRITGEEVEHSEYIATHHRPHYESRHLHPSHRQEEYVELHKRESDI